MKNVKKCLKKHLGDNFQIKNVGDDLELTPKDEAIYGICSIVDVVRAFNKAIYISTKQNQGIYIRIF